MIKVGTWPHQVVMKLLRRQPMPSTRLHIDRNGTAIDKMPDFAAVGHMVMGEIGQARSGMEVAMRCRTLSISVQTIVALAKSGQNTSCQLMVTRARRIDDGF
jgi:hypothetical protein